MPILNDLLALMLAILISVLLFIPNLLFIVLSIVSLMLSYFFFKYTSKKFSPIILLSFFLLLQSKYHPFYYNYSLIVLLFFLVYAFFYVVHSKNYSITIKREFSSLEIKIKEFLNVLTAFDYLPNNIKIFDELTAYMKGIFPEIYSLAIFQKTPFGWQPKSTKNLSISKANIYLKDLSIQSLKKYFSLNDAEVFVLPIKLEGDEYSIVYNCIDVIEDKDLMEYFLRTLLVLSLRFEKKYFLGLESALVNESGLIHFDVYKKFAQTILEIASKTSSTILFVMFYLHNYNDDIDKVKQSIKPPNILVSMGANKILAVFPDTTVKEVKNRLTFLKDNLVFAQYPDDGLSEDKILTALEQRILVKKNENEFIQKA